MNTFKNEQKELLSGIFEMDETYIKTSKNNTKDEDDDNNNTGFGDFDDEIPFDKVGTVAYSNTTAAIVINNFVDGTQTIRDKFGCGCSTKNNTSIVAIKHKVEDIKAFIQQKIYKIRNTRQNSNANCRIWK